MGKDGLYHYSFFHGSVTLCPKTSFKLFTMLRTTAHHAMWVAKLDDQFLDQKESCALLLVSVWHMHEDYDQFAL